MKKLKVILSITIIASALVVVFLFMNQNKSLADNNTLLYDWVVYVKYNANAPAPGATVRILLNGVDQFESPKNTNASGVAWFENDGSHFPNGTYTVTATKSGYGFAQKTVVISGYNPSFPRDTLNIGYPE